MGLANIPTEHNPTDIATKALDQLTIQKHPAACEVMTKTVDRAADKKEVSHLNGHAHKTPPALIPAFLGLQACAHGLAIWAATSSFTL